VDQQFKALLDNLPGVAYRCANDSRCTVYLVSAYIYDLLGYEPEVFFEETQTGCPKSLVDLTHPDDLAHIRNSIEEHLASRSAYSMAYRMQHADGHMIWVQEVGRGVFDEQDNLQYLDGFILDITELHLAREALLQTNRMLQTQQSRLEATSQIARLGHWQAWLDSGELWWSDVIYDIFGLDPESTEPSVELFFASVHPEDISLIRASEKHALETGLHDVEHRIILPDGQVRWVHELAQTILDADGKPFRLDGTVQDITQRKDADRLKQDFISTVSHELRTPLTAIAGVLRLLQAGVFKGFSAEAMSLIQMAGRNAEHLSRLINDLLDVETLSRGRMAYHFSMVDLQLLIPEIVHNQKVFAADRRVSIDLAIESLRPFRLDPQRFTQILTNLLSNAIKFSPEGGRIVISLTRERGDAVIRVKDQGPGIPVSFYNRIFQRFAQADSSDTRRTGGTGLGLAISKTLTEEMGGTIGFDSEVGQGACFWLKWPLSSDVVPLKVEGNERGPQDES